MTPWQGSFPPPSRRVANPYSATQTATVVALASRANVNPLQWQRSVLDDWTATDPDTGKVIHNVCGLAAPRQNGKSVDAQWWALKRAMVDGYRVLWTEHNYSTTCEMIARFKAVLGRKRNDKLAPFPGFNRHVAAYSSKISAESFTFDSGGAVHFATRTKSTTLGYSFDMIVIDEAQQLLEEHVQAILPTTTSASHHDSQIIYLGTPPRVGSVADSFARVRENILGGIVKNACWSEWGVEEIGDVADEARWYACNPSLAEGLADVNAIRTDLGGMAPITFAQEHLGYWLPRIEQARAIPSDKWARCATDAPPRGDVSFGAKVSVDGTECAVSACVRPKDGRPHVELVEVWDVGECGTSVVVDWLAARADSAACIVIDGQGIAPTMVKALRDRGVPRAALRIPTATEFATSCAMLLDLVNGQQLTHFAQQPLTDSATFCTRREIGSKGGWGFETTDNGDATLIESACLALWGAMTTRRKPGQKTRGFF